MKAKILAAAFFAAGMLVAAAQSNPSSTNGVDTEMELPWPNGAVYLSSYNVNDYLSWNDPLLLSIYANCNWSETGGGTAYYVSTGYSEQQFTNEVTWPGSSWPVWANGQSIFLNGGGTNNAVPPGYYPYPPFPKGSTYNIGSVNIYFPATPSSGGALFYNYTEQSQVTLVTGGAPGTTGSELFGISASGLNRLPNDYNILPQQITVATFGALNTNGLAFAVLPLHTQVPITANASSAQYAQISVSAQPYQLVSQCVATTPANQARTTIGVGEQVNLSFSPTLPINAVWSTTAGSLSYITNTSTQFTAPSNATSATVTATIPGQPPLGITFNVVAPNGVDHAVITSTNSTAYAIGLGGAEMNLNIYIAPTNVSFYRVEIMEVGEDAIDNTGYFAYNAYPNYYSTNDLFHSTADEWTTPLNQDNSLPDGDTCGTPAFLPPWVGGGGFTWPIPAEWRIEGSAQTNNLPNWSNQVFLMDGNGTVTLSKFGESITRTTNNIITTN